MRKEKLTLLNIKQDLKSEIKSAYIELAFDSLAFILILLLLIAFANVSADDIVLFFKYLLVGIGEAVIAVFLIRRIMYIVVLHKNLKNKNAIVKDKLINSEEKEKRQGKHIVKYYYLYFSQYGTYKIPDNNYEWSSMFALGDKGVYNYAGHGDEFYLVLSKPHNGKILLAYNDKMFEME